MSNETKAVVFIEPLSKTMEELYNLLLPDPGNGVEFELYRPSTTLEVSQTLPQLGPSLLITADHKICALTLAQNKTIIKGLKSKIIIINERKLPAKILDKFHKSGLTDYILEPIALKTLIYKVKLLVKSLPVIGKEKEFGNKLKSGEDKKVLNTEESTLIKDKEQKVKSFLERKKQELDQNKERNEKINELKETRAKEELSKKEEGRSKSSDKAKSSSFNFNYSNDSDNEVNSDSTDLKQESSLKEEQLGSIAKKSEETLKENKSEIIKETLKKTKKVEEDNSSSFQGKNSKAERLSSALKSESHYKDQETTKQSHSSNYQEKESGNLQGSTEGEAALSDLMRGTNNFTEKQSGNLEGDINTNQRESSFLSGKSTYQEKSLEDLKGDITSKDFIDSNPQKSNSSYKDDLGGHYKGEQETYHDEILGQAIHKRKNLKKKDEVEVQEEIEIEYVYEDEEVNRPHEGQTDHLGQKMRGKNSSDKTDTGNLIGHGKREKLGLAHQNSTRSTKDTIKKETEGKHEHGSPKEDEDLPELINLIDQLEEEASENEKGPRNSEIHNKSKKAGSGFTEKSNPMISHTAEVDHIEKYYGLKTAKEREKKKSTWNLHSSLKNNSSNNGLDRDGKPIKDKKILQFGQLSEGKGQINYGQIFEDFKDLDSESNDKQEREAEDLKSVETLAALIQFHEYSKDAKLDSIDLLKKFHQLFNQIYSFEFSIHLDLEKKPKEIYHSLRGRKVDLEIAQEFQDEKDKIEIDCTIKKLNFFECKNLSVLKHKEKTFAYVSIFFYKQAQIPNPEWLVVLEALQSLLLDVKDLKGAA